MKLKFTLRSSGDLDTDLVATVDSTTTVGDLASYLVLADPHRPAVLRSPAAGEFTLARVDAGHSAIDPRVTISESGVRSGAHVAVTRRGEAYADQGRAVAMATITDGPDTGQQIPLEAGTAYIGRGRGCEVPLSDQTVSRQHARLIVGDVVEVVDLGSANGITVNGEQVTKVVLRPTDRVRLGDTEIEVRLAEGNAGVVSNEAGNINFSRSPRIAPLYAGREWKVPDLPERKRPEHIPWITAFIPGLLGLSLYITTRQVSSLLFVLLMPAMVLGSTWETRRSAKKEYEEALVDFREDIGFLSREIVQEHQVEVAVRGGEQPSSEECLKAVRARSELVWTRRRGDPGYMELRLGLGTLPSRSQIKLPDVGRSRAEAWLELSRAMDGLSTVDGVPVGAYPLENGSIGISGPRSSALPAAWSLLLQAVALHSPADLVVAAFASSATAPDWDWLKWLPHTASPHSPIGARHLTNGGPAAVGLLSELEELLATGQASAKDRPAGGTGKPTVLVVVEDDAPLERARLVQLAEHGWQHDIVVLWISPSTQLLPAACRTFLETRGPKAPAMWDTSALQEQAPAQAPAPAPPSLGAAAAFGIPVDQPALGPREREALARADASGYVAARVLIRPVSTDRVTRNAVIEASKRLAPMVDSGAPVQDDSDLPRSVSLLSLTGPELALNPQNVIDSWSENRSILTGPFAPEVLPRKPGTLRAMVGQTAQEPFSIDLRADGPHALVGGTTGAGKSELLQAWILGMATANSPQRITFLLVDYKGGSAFRDCVNLPHTVGLVTDLSPHLVRRALASLSAELRYREHILAAHRAKDLVELERRGETDAPPSLVIVVDEFAALVQEVPDFVDGVVNVAQRGRSLGLHLILATQRPQGVIKDNLRANTNLRLALRMADEDDSSDVLGTSAAAYFDPALPGRAMSKSGPGRLTPFQTAYAGGWTSDNPPPPEMTVETLGFGAGTVWELPAIDEDPAEEQRDLGPTDIQRLVTQITGAADRAELPAARKPWLPELGNVYELASLPTKRRDDVIVFGVSDDPDSQTQPVVTFEPDREGNLVVFGASGSGKTAFLRSVAVAAGYTVRGGPCHVYGLDFGNRGLAMLADLPHVGSIISADDHERVQRLLRFLRETIDDRAVRFSRASASTITEYRGLADQPDEPRIFVLLDGLAAFRQAYDNARGQGTLDALTGLVADGRPVGVHFILTADQRSALWTSLSAGIQQRLVMRMAQADDYFALDLPADVLSAASPAGRGLIHGREVQVAVLGGTSDVVGQTRAMEAFAAAVRRAGGAEPVRIRSLPAKVELSRIPVGARDRVLVGISSTTLEPDGFTPRGGFIVVGPSGSGRTTTVLTIAQALSGTQPDSPIYLFTPRRTALSQNGPWAKVAIGSDQCQEVAEELTEAFEADAEHPPRVTLVIERVDELADTLAETAISAAVKAIIDSEQLCVAEGDTSFFGSSYGLGGLIRGSRSGISLQPDGMDAQAFATDYRGLPQNEMLEGRGYLIRRGRPELFQVALPNPLSDNESALNGRRDAGLVQAR